MESERPYRTTSTNSSSNSSTTSELFICFTSRLSSSSSMKLSSKSILSPGRTREPSQISLSSSLSRRLRSNGSMKGGQASPMFPTGAKKRGCAFENPEPSSPKVTCIGQVRVKTKKQGNKLRTRSKRRGEASFRRVEQQNTSLNVTQQEVNVQNNSQFQSQQLLQQQQQQQQQHECSSHRNQRWVHLPVTICEGLRAFGAEFNCFLPCRSSCMREKEEKAERSEGGGNGSSCGAVFARWLVAMQENEGKGGREIELVVGEEESETESVRRKSRREIFEGIEIKEERIEEEDQEEGRVSICIPPKNALLLMRCRSDPVKMAALANRFWESPVHDKDEDEDEDNENVEHEEGEEEQQQQQQRDLEERQSIVEVDEDCDSQEHGYPEEKANLVLEEEEEKIVVEENPELPQHPEGQENHEEEKLQVKEELFEEVNQPVPEPELKQEPEALVDPEVFEHNVVLQEIEDVQENEAEAEHEEEDEEEASFSSPTLVSIHSEQESEAQALEEEEEEEEEEAKVEALAEDEDEEESLSGTPWEDEETVTNERFEPEEEEEEEEEEEDPNTHEKEPGMEESKFRESQQRKPERERERESSVLPDCLLLMMCEPKLSMEVSKETWVCSTDFIRWLPERPIKKTNGGDGKDPKKRVISTATEDNSKNPAPPTHTAAPHHLLLQPPRSSCSFPAAVAAAAAPGAGVSMATMIEQKLVGAKGYEPFVLTRCKSEPMRSSAKLMPEPCFWKNRKLEPHRPATLGVGAAGVGF